MRLLLALFIVASPVTRRQVRVLSNGEPLPTQQTLRLSGPFQCGDNTALSPPTTDCACPNTGVMAQGLVQFTLQQQGRVEIDAKWVTGNTVISCTPIASVPLRLSIPPDSIKPGIGFSVIVEAPNVTLGLFNVGCIGAVAQEIK